MLAGPAGITRGAVPLVVAEILCVADQTHCIAGQVANRGVFPPVDPACGGNQAGGDAIGVGGVAGFSNIFELARASGQDDVFDTFVAAVDDIVVESGLTVDLDSGRGEITGLLAVGKGLGAGSLGDLYGLAVYCGGDCAGDVVCGDGIVGDGACGRAEFFE